MFVPFRELGLIVDVLSVVVKMPKNKKSSESDSDSGPEHVSSVDCFEFPAVA